MILQINSSDNTKITMYPTGEELSSVYGKYSFKLFSGGAMCNGGVHATPTQEQPLPTNIRVRQIVIAVENGQTDDLALYTKLKEYYEGLGYTVSILDN